MTISIDKAIEAHKNKVPLEASLNGGNWETVPENAKMPIKGFCQIFSTLAFRLK